MPPLSDVCVSKKTEAIMQTVDRVLFLPYEVEKYAYENRPLPIGYGATCSAPSIVAVMTELLDFAEGMQVLEIGAGCGYHAAVTAVAIGRSGRLTTVEIVPELAAMARNNIKAGNVNVVETDGTHGFAKHAPYDRIYLTAAVDGDFLPETLLSQLKQDGILMYPVDEGGGGPLRVIKKRKDMLQLTDYKNVIFVPLQKKSRT